MKNWLIKIFAFLIPQGDEIVRAYAAICRETKNRELRAQAKERFDRHMRRGMKPAQAIGPVLAWLRCECREAELRRGAAS